MCAHLISGADEKVIRIFDAPFSTVKDLNSISGTNYRYHDEMTNEEM